jgi:pimeloyl-ACP methyl ester carboxylesterase
MGSLFLLQEQNDTLMVLLPRVSMFWFMVNLLSIPMSDLYCRGYSDSPGITHDSALYTHQLLGLLSYLKWTDGSVDIMGLSMGGAIVVDFVRLFPYLVDRVVLIAPAGLLKSMALPGYVLLIPIFGELLMYTLGKYLLIDNAKSQFTKNIKADQVSYRIIHFLVESF